MGHTYVDVFIGNGQGGKEVKAFVDTGSTFTLLPLSLAREARLTMLQGQQKVEMADGSLKEYPVAAGRIGLLGRETWATILVGEFSEPVLGVLTLEALGLAVDPASGEIYPSRGWQARGPFQVRPRA